MQPDGGSPSLRMRYRLMAIPAAVAMLTLNSCGYGGRQTRDVSPVPNLAIPPAQMQPAPMELPEPVGASDSALLVNHIEVTVLYRAVARRLNALICTLQGQTHITINGARPHLSDACLDQHGRPKDHGSDPRIEE